MTASAVVAGDRFTVGRYTVTALADARPAPRRGCAPAEVLVDVADAHDPRAGVTALVLNADAPVVLAPTR